MEQRDVGVPNRDDVVGEQIDPPARQHPRWLHPGWDLEPRHLTWVSNYRDSNDVLRDCLNFVCKPLHLIQRGLAATFRRK